MHAEGGEDLDIRLDEFGERIGRERGTILEGIREACGEGTIKDADGFGEKSGLEFFIDIDFTLVDIKHSGSDSLGRELDAMNNISERRERVVIAEVFAVDISPGAGA